MSFFNNNNSQYRPSGFGYLPVVTKNIIIINVIMYVLKLALQAQQINLDDYLGLHYYLAPSFRPHQFITYIFMHGSFQHLLFNMLAVFIFGQVLEQVWGPKRYIIFYLLTGLGAALAQYVIIYFEISPLLNSIAYVQANLTQEHLETLINSSAFRMNSEFASEFNRFAQQYNEAIRDNPNKAMSIASQFLIDYKNNRLDANVIVGASGSLFGLLGAFGMLFPNRELYLYFLFPVKAKWLVTAYGAFELFSGLRNDPMDNVAHFAHIGGLLVGIIIVLIWRKDKQHFY